MEGTSSVTERARKKGWITVKEAASRSGFSEPTIYRWAREETVEKQKVAGYVFVSEASLKKHLGRLGKELLEEA